jgi:hypothetical protein
MPVCAGMTNFSLRLIRASALGISDPLFDAKNVPRERIRQSRLAAGIALYR